ncbi:DUF1579 domain-containing protein [Echinicola soli]|uniref:DUF1579 domain-containing protein n=1 Tax=Echinicola soli TaxID=2591634 RepID=A0A514CFD8_9BACT|nr:DUF1579 family protein [Echinicola soli]QDH78532.1 DUF1579 domain-containing protein [Echinicola soli]
MKELLCIISMIPALASGPGLAQSSADEAMSQLSFLEGKWQGPATVTTGSNQATEISQHENVEFRLSGKALIIEGKGYQADSIAFNALAIVTFDEHSQAYNMRSWLANGMSTEAYFTLKGERHIEWGFDMANGGALKYTIQLDEQGRWQENGQYSPNGSQWYPSFEMQLTKK